MLRDRGDQLKYAIAHALLSASKIVRGLRAGLTVSERENVVEAAVNQIRALPNDPWKLSEPLPQYRTEPRRGCLSGPAHMARSR
jgi:hypothetical protein